MIYRGGDGWTALGLKYIIEQHRYKVPLCAILTALAAAAAMTISNISNHETIYADLCYTVMTRASWKWIHQLEYYI